jgi:hypothetical protein
MLIVHFVDDREDQRGFVFLPGSLMWVNRHVIRLLTLVLTNKKNNIYIYQYVSTVSPEKTNIKI